jgi:serine/threonine-protein kinase
VLSAPIPSNEQERLDLLQACEIMYTPAEQAFDDVAQLAADLCGTEIALITLVDSDYQWFKARVGVEQSGTARDMSFCGHCIVQREAMIVEDTHRDPRFADNPLVTGEPHLRFYAGIPLIVEGHAVGALSVASRTPRGIEPRHLDSLRRLATRISRELELRRALGRQREAAPTVAVDDMPIGPGDRLGDRWTVQREIGRGGAGVVFEARDDDGLRVAVKVLLPAWAKEEALHERFAREARVLMRLTSPHVGRLYDVGNLDTSRGGLPFMVLEYLEGRDLGGVLAAEGRVPFAQAFAWCADACEGVAAAHDLRIVHRDLKPSNVFLAADAVAAPVVKVLDFGIAAGDPVESNPRLTAHDDIIGSPAYMSPEQIMAQPIDQRSDVWSMGALLYELVTGVMPFRGGSPFEIFAKINTLPPVPLVAYVNDLPSTVQEIVMTCLRKRREERFSSMRDLASALRSAGQNA